MTTHMTKTWFEDGRIIEQVIPEAEIYKREWVGLTDEEIILLSGYDLNYAALIGEVQKKLKEKNT